MASGQKASLTEEGKAWMRQAYSMVGELKKEVEFSHEGRTKIEKRKHLRDMAAELTVLISAFHRVLDDQSSDFGKQALMAKMDLAHSYVRRIPSDVLRNIFPKSAQPKPKISPTGSRPSSACSSSATLSTKNTSEIHKPLARRSIGLPLGSMQMTVAKVTPSKLPPRRKSMDNNSQPALKMAVAGAQRAFALEKSSMKSQTSTSNSSLSSTETRVMLSAKRRVSADPKSMSPLVKPAIPQLKTLTPKPLLNKSTGGSATPGNPSGIHKLSTPRASASGTESYSNQKRSISPNPGVKRAAGTGGGSRSSMLKKPR